MIFAYLLLFKDYVLCLEFSLLIEFLKKFNYFTFFPVTHTNTFSYTINRNFNLILQYEVCNVLQYTGILEIVFKWKDNILQT